MTIEITQKDINIGGNDFICCPVQRAISRHTNHLVHVSRNFIRFFPNEHSTSFASIYLPTKVRDWIKEYDCKDEPNLKPFSFNLSAECFIIV